MTVLGTAGVTRAVRSGLRAAVRSARVHWLLVILVAAGAALRVIATLAYYPALLYVDSFAYLGGVTDVRAAGEDPVGYSVLLLRPVLALGNLTAVVVVQHLLGLAMAVAVYALLRRHDVRRWLSALAVAPVLLDAYQIQLEQNVLSDTLFEALVVAALVVLAWPNRPPLWRVAVGVGLLGLSVTVRDVGELMIVPALIFVLIAVRGLKGRLVAVCVACAAFVVPLAGYGAYHYAAAGSVGLTSESSLYLYARAATVADCTTLRLPADERELCPRTPIDDRLGIDSYAHSTASPVYPILAKPNADALEKGFATAVMRQQPVAYAGSIARDFLHGFAVDRTHSPSDTPVSRWQFQTYYVTWPPYNPTATSEQYGQGRPAVDSTLARILRDYQLGGGYTPGPLLAVALILGLAGCLRRDRRRAACVLFTLGGLGVLGLADLFEYSLRYQMPALAVLPAAGALGLTALINRRRQSHIDHSPDSGAPAAPSSDSAASSVADSPGAVPVSSPSARIP